MGASAVGSWRSHDGGRPAGSSGRSAELPAELLQRAHGYARDTLLLPAGAATDGLIAAAVVRSARRGGSSRPPTDADERLHEAIRHEVWRRQRRPERMRKAHLEARRRFEESPTGPQRRTGRVVLAAVFVAMVVIAGVLVVRAARDEGDASSEASAASTRPGRVRGTVLVDGSGSATAGLDGVKVALADADGGTVARAHTDRLGRFTFSEVAPATYEIEVSPPAGFEEAGGSGDGPVTAEVTVEPGADLPLTIVLEPV